MQKSLIYIAPLIYTRKYKPQINFVSNILNKKFNYKQAMYKLDWNPIHSNIDKEFIINYNQDLFSLKQIKVLMSFNLFIGKFPQLNHYKLNKKFNVDDIKYIDTVSIRNILKLYQQHLDKKEHHIVCWYERYLNKNIKDLINGIKYNYNTPFKQINITIDDNGDILNNDVSIIKNRILKLIKRYSL